MRDVTRLDQGATGIYSTVSQGGMVRLSIGWTTLGTHLKPCGWHGQAWNMVCGGQRVRDGWGGRGWGDIQGSQWFLEGSPTVRDTPFDNAQSPH